MRVVIAPGPPGPPTGATAFAATPFTLAHPRTGAPSQFLLVDGRVYEASLFRPPTGAWFAGEGVVSDGGVGLVAPLDPLLLALPLLEASRGVAAATADSPGQFRDAEQALGEAGPAGVALLAALAAVGDAAGGPPPPPAPAGDAATDDDAPPTQPTPTTAAHARTLAAATMTLASICETRTVGPDAYVRLDDARAAAWLALKAERVGGALRAAAGGAGAAAALDEPAAAAAGAALLAEWLPPAWASRLGVPTEAEAAAARAAAVAAARANPGGAGVGGRGGEEWESNEDRAKRLKSAAADKARRKAAEARVEAKAVAAKKEAAGMKSLSAFFVKK